MEAEVKDSGKLKEDFHPAVYCDTSVLIDYMLAENLLATPIIPSNQAGETLRNILKSEKRLTQVAEIRKKILYSESKVCPVTTQFALWEIIEWHAEGATKQAIAQKMGVSAVQRKSKKEIGEVICRIVAAAKQEKKEELPKNRLSSPLQNLWHSISFDSGYALTHSLKGIYVASIVNFSLPPLVDGYPSPFDMSFVQIGPADILHIFFAKHLGCEYVASFDNDFARAKPLLTMAGMKLLTTPQEVLNVL